MIQFNKVEKGYGGKVLFGDVSLKINKGEKCGLVGRNGSGKTTLLRLLTREEEPDSGEILVPKEYKLGYLTQHLHFSQHTILDEACLSLRSEDKANIYKAEKILSGLGFKERDFEKSPNAFSGGYQLRLHLAKVLIQEPNCLLLDEPTNYLDIVSIRWFKRFLSRWNGELVMISHDRDFMDEAITHVIGIHRQQVQKQKGDTRIFYEYILQKEQLHEKARINLEKKKEHMEVFITKLGAKATKAAQAKSRKKALARMPVLEELAQLHHLNFTFPYSPFPSAKLLEAKNISFTYENLSAPLIENFSLVIEKHERIAIVGKNGRGKSTLLRLLSGDLIPEKGSLKSSPNAKIGYFGQTNIERLNLDKTIEEEIASTCNHLTVSQVRNICGKMMFPKEQAEKKIAFLSGGEKSRVLLGKLLASPSNLLLLDEPTNHLDMESIEALMTALDQFEGAVVMITHSEAILHMIPEKFVICHQSGQHLFVGSYSEFLEQEGWEPIEKKETKKFSHPQREKRILDREDRKKQKEIKKVENQIIGLETKREEQTHALLIASQKGDASLIAELSKNIHLISDEIEKLFSLLEILYN